MHKQTSRRDFLAGLGVMAAATVLPPGLAVAAPQGIQFGYTAMTWGDQERQAIDDIADLGYRGIQFRANVIDHFKPAELRALLERKRLTFTALSSGTVTLNARPEEEIARHVANAQYVKDSGGLYLQLLDQLKSYPRQALPGEHEQMGRLLTEIGKRTADLGIASTYHNHLNTLSETPAGLDRLMAATDPRYVKFELDTAHAVAGGGDPVKMIEAYRERLLFLHLKDLVDLAPVSGGKYPFQFVELGRGRVDFPVIFKALGKADFRGWAVIELDRVVDKSRTAKQSAEISKTYLAQKLGLQVS